MALTQKQKEYLNDEFKRITNDIGGIRNLDKIFFTIGAEAALDMIKSHPEMLDK